MANRIITPEQFTNEMLQILREKLEFAPRATWVGSQNITALDLSLLEMLREARQAYVGAFNDRHPEPQVIVDAADTVTFYRMARGGRALLQLESRRPAPCKILAGLTLPVQGDDAPQRVLGRGEIFRSLNGLFSRLA